MSFHGVDWQAYIPLRLSDVLISKNQQPWKAAVLANPANGDPDLALPVDELELQIFNAVDSHRTIANIIQLVAAQQGKRPDVLRSHAQLLFERLWWYDLVGGFILPFKCGQEIGATQ